MALLVPPLHDTTEAWRFLTAPPPVRSTVVESPLSGTNRQLQGATLHEILAAFAPNRVISKTTVRVIIAFQGAIVLVIWINSPFPVLPQPMEVLRAFRTLWFE